MSIETARELNPFKRFDFHFWNLLPFVPALLMGSAQSLVGLSRLSPKPFRLQRR
jgi:hypothetical protein